MGQSWPWPPCRRIRRDVVNVRCLCRDATGRARDSKPNMSSKKRQTAVLAEPPGRLRQRLPLLAAMLVAAAAAIAFGWRTLDAGFIMGDDQRFVTDHFLVNHPSLENAWTLLTVPHGDLYQPIPMLTFQADYAMASQSASGVSPYAFHLTNVLLHALNAMLVVLLGAALARRVVVGALAGLLFATHPMAMETVAWVSGRMILLATLFSLIVLILAVRRSRTPGRGWAIGIWLVWVASLVSKVMPTIPIVAWLFDRKVHRKADRRGLWTYVALFVIGAAAVAAMSRLSAAEGFGDGLSGGASSSIKSMLLEFGQYVEQYVVPTRLSPWTPPVGDVAWSDVRIFIALAELVGVLAMIFALRKRASVVCVGLAAFVLLLAPFLVASLARRLFVADRYMYLPMVGLHLAVVAAFCGIARVLFGGKRSPGDASRRADVVASVPVIGLAAWWFVVGIGLAPVWKDTLAYAKRVVTCFPNRADAHNELARAYLFMDRPADALTVARDGLNRWPDSSRLASQLGEAENRLGHYSEALAAFDRSLATAPHHTRTRYLRALTLLSLGRGDDARTSLQSLVKDQPGFLPAYSALARVYRDAGDTANLRKTLDKALGINPRHRDNLFELAMLDYNEGRLDAAEKLLRQLLDLDPHDTPALLNLGAALAKKGRNIAAVKCYDRLLAFDPSATAARFNRGDLLVGLGQLADAEQDFRVVLKRDPGNLDAAARLHQVLVMGHRWSDLLGLWRNVGEATSDSAEVACYAEWAKVLRAFDRHEPLPASASGLQSDDACAAWIAVYARFRERDFQGLAAALDRLPNAPAAADQVERRRRVVMGAFEALPVELRNSRAGLFIAARLSAYLRDASNAVRFSDVLAQGDDEWAARAKALRSRLNVVGAKP